MFILLFDRCCLQAVGSLGDIIILLGLVDRLSKRKGRAHNGGSIIGVLLGHTRLARLVFRALDVVLIRVLTVEGLLTGNAGLFK